MKKSSFVVPGVRVGRSSEEVTFHFVGKNNYRCTAQGRAPLRVFYSSEDRLFKAEMAGRTGMVFAKTADLAFARAVRVFWNP